MVKRYEFILQSRSSWLRKSSWFDAALLVAYQLIAALLLWVLHIDTARYRISSPNEIATPLCTFESTILSRVLIAMGGAARRH